jgi:flagellar FliL protein
MKRIGIVIAALILVGTTGFFGYHYFIATKAQGKEGGSAEAGAEHGSDAKPEEKEHGSDAKPEEKEHGSPAEKGSESGGSAHGGAGRALFPLRTFVVNLADPQRERYLKTTLALVVNKSVQQRLTTDDLLLATVQDRTLTILTTKTVEELMSAEGKFLLKQEITLQLNSILGEGSIQELYFADFIIQ